MKITSIIVISLIAGLLFMGPAFSQEASIKIGFIGAMTGGSAVLGQRCSEGFKMFWDEFNEKGGLKGGKVELVIDDDEALPAKAISAANKQIVKDEIVSGFATTNTAVTYAILPVFQKFEVPHVTQVFGAGITTAGSKYVFRVGPTINTYVETIYGYCTKNLGLKTVAIVSDKGGFGKDIGDAWENVAPKYGVKVLTREKCNMEDRDFTGQLIKIKTLKPDALVSAVGSELMVALLAKNMRKLGMDIPLLQGSQDVDKYLEYAGEAGDGTIMALAFVSFDQPKERTEFARRFKAKYRRDPVVHSVWGYDAANILAIALEKSYPTITRANVYKGITSISNVRLIQGVYNYTNTQEGISMSEIVKIVGGKVVKLE